MTARGDRGAAAVAPVPNCSSCSPSPSWRSSIPARWTAAAPSTSSAAPARRSRCHPTPDADLPAEAKPDPRDTVVLHGERAARAIVRFAGAIGHGHRRHRIGLAAARSGRDRPVQSAGGAGRRAVRPGRRRARRVPGGAGEPRRDRDGDRSRRAGGDAAVRAGRRRPQCCPNKMDWRARPAAGLVRDAADGPAGWPRRRGSRPGARPIRTCRRSGSRCRTARAATCCSARSPPI